MKDYGDTNFITGLRAFAAFAVVLIHAGGGGLRELGAIGNAVADLGRAGVYVFFVISGFSVGSSYRGDYLAYINRRFWRIAPLYYFWIAFAVLSGSTAVYWQRYFNIESIDAYNVLMHIGFVSFLDYRIANSILGVEWSIPIEVFWYFLVPPLIQLMSPGGRICAVLAVAVLLYLVSGWLTPPDAALALYWSPLPYVISYCLGVAAFKLRSSSLTKWGKVTILATIGLLLLYVTRPKIVLTIFHDEMFFVSALTFALIVCSSNESLKLLSSRVAVFLGVISYGVYLCHVPILALLIRWPPPGGLEDPMLKFVWLCLAATFASTATYYAIERPGQVLGAKLWAIRWRAKQSA